MGGTTVLPMAKQVEKPASAFETLHAKNLAITKKASKKENPDEDNASDVKIDTLEISALLRRHLYSGHVFQGDVPLGLTYCAKKSLTRQMTTETLRVSWQYIENGSYDQLKAIYYFRLQPSGMDPIPEIQAELLQDVLAWKVENDTVLQDPVFNGFLPMFEVNA